MSRIKQRISSLVRDQLPEFLREDYELFVLFLEYYYKFLEQDSNALEIVQNARSYSDIDTTTSDFIQYFLTNYAKDVPVTALLDRSLLIKRIRYLYESKGSQLSFQTLFSIFYNSKVEYKHPYDFVLRPSDGTWSQRVSIHVDRIEGDANQLENKLLKFDRGGFQYSTPIDRIKILSQDRYEIFLQTNSIPPYEIGNVVYAANATHVVFTGNIIPTLTNYRVVQSGTGFKPGQVYSINTDNGVDTLLKVDRVSNTKGIETVTILNYGYGYSGNITIGLNSRSDSITQAENIYGSLFVTGNGGNFDTGIGDTYDIFVFTGLDSTISSAGKKWKTIGGSGSKAIKTDGTLWGWGNTWYGYNLTPVDSSLFERNGAYYLSAPSLISSSNDWLTLASNSGAGIYHTGAIKTDGTLWMWGRNDYGQLGDESIIHRSSPVQTIAGGTNWKQLSCGNLFTGAVKNDGTLWMWGRNTNGPLGTNDRNHRSSPVQTIAGGTNWKQVACGGFFESSFAHTAAVKTDGSLWVWGHDLFYQTGQGTNSSYKLSPIQTSTLGTNWKQVAAGSTFTSAVKTDGSLWTWGSSSNKGLGYEGDINTTTQSVPKQLGTDRGNVWEKVTISYDSGYATDNTDIVFAWGSNDQGKLGLGVTVANTYNLTSVIGVTTTKDVSSGVLHAVILQEENYSENQAIIELFQGAVGRYPGQYITNKGFTSEPDVRLQDSNLYQPFAYQLSSELDISVFYDTVKKLIHPAGTNLFSNRVLELTANLLGNVSVLVSSNADVDIIETVSTLDTLSYLLSNSSIGSQVQTQDTILVAYNKPLSDSLLTQDTLTKSINIAVSDLATTQDSNIRIRTSTGLSDFSNVGETLVISANKYINDQVNSLDTIYLSLPNSYSADPTYFAEIYAV